MIHVRLIIEMPEDEVSLDYRPQIVHLTNLRGQVRGLLADAQRDAEAWLASRDPAKSEERADDEARRKARTA